MVRKLRAEYKGISKRDAQCRIRGIMTADEKTLSPEPQVHLNRIKARFATTALSKKMCANPPKRGPHGMATINLLPNARSRVQRPFRLVGERKAASAELVEEFASRGWLEPSTAGWSSPAFVVPKEAAGKWRMVVDYRWLNDCTMVDVCPLPLVDPLLNLQRQKKIWTVLDMKHGYHQLPLDEASRAATTMSVP